MATYKLVFHMNNNTTITVEPTGKPEAIVDMAKELAESDYQVYKKDDDKATLVCIANVNCVTIERKKG